MNTMPHILSGDELSADEIKLLIQDAISYKSNRTSLDVLKDKHIALIFDKASLRTRFSFTVAVHELGGDIVESVSSTRKDELPQDFIRVVQGYCAGMMIRMSDHDFMTAMVPHATIPIINGLSDRFHPCQTLADLQTIYEHFGKLNGLKVCFVGDANNVFNSFALMAKKLGVDVTLACPPHIKTMQGLDHVRIEHCPQKAVEGCDVVYTDVWTSMGFADVDETKFTDYQVNEDLMEKAGDHAVVLHCMPMERGKEISHTLPDAKSSLIFKQSENRLHAQKALLNYLFK